MSLRAFWIDFISALQFLTRLPVRVPSHDDDTLARSAKFFPAIGLVVGGSAGLLYLFLDAHLPRLVTSTFVVAFLVCVTGSLHEDGLADAADGFGGGWNREGILMILRDSRIGSYGGAALVLSLGLRTVLLSSLSRAQVLPLMVSAHVLCRWSTLPLSYFLPAARVSLDGVSSGQGARVARHTSLGTLIFGTAFSWLCCGALLRWNSVPPILASIALAVLSGLYYKRRIGGVTGDCFGATNQLTEIAVYICGEWVA